MDSSLSLSLFPQLSHTRFGICRSKLMSIVFRLMKKEEGKENKMQFLGANGGR